MDALVLAARPYFESHGVGRVWIAVALVAAVIEVSGVFRHRAEATRRDRGSQYILRLCIAPGVVVLAVAPRIVPGADIHPPFVAVVVGIVVFSAGEAMRVWARATLGRYFTYAVMTSRDQPVITSGPYRFVRHPSYTGVLLISLGVGLAFANWLGLAALAVATLAGLRYRIHVEERALLEDLRDRYAAFAAHRKRLVPLIW